MKDIPVRDKLGEDAPFRIKRMKEVIKVTQAHRHDQYYELIYLNRGAGFHVVDAISYRVEPPILFFLHPGQVHRWEFTSIPAGFVLMFSVDFFSVERGRSVAEEIRGIPAAHSLSRTTQQEIERSLLDLEEEMDRHGLTGNRVLYHTLLSLLHRVSRIATDTSMASANPRLRLFDSLLQRVESCFLEKRTVRSYAVELGLTERQLSVLCHEFRGLPFREILQARRLLEAKRLLLHSTNTVTEIAATLQFNDSNHFSKSFKRGTGRTPGQFRETMATGPNAKTYQ